MSLRKLEDEAHNIARDIAKDASKGGLPVDGGLIGKLMRVVREAHQEGYDQAVREVSGTWKQRRGKR